MPLMFETTGSTSQEAVWQEVGVNVLMAIVAAIPVVQ